jgi:hypothetical protein
LGREHAPSSLDVVTAETKPIGDVDQARARGSSVVGDAHAGATLENIIAAGTV